MSPRIALTTACSDSPSKLNVAAPLVAPRFGGGAEAALRLITWPVPRRISGRAPASAPSCSGSDFTPLTPVTTTERPVSPALDVPAAGARLSSPRRCTFGGGMLAQAAITVARTATSALRRWKRANWERKVIAGGTLRVLGRCCGVLGLLAQLRPALFDALADAFHLLLGRGLVAGGGSVRRRLGGGFRGGLGCGAIHRLWSHLRPEHRCRRRFRRIGAGIGIRVRIRTDRALAGEARALELGGRLATGAVEHAQLQRVRAVRPFEYRAARVDRGQPIGRLGIG